MKFLTGNIEYLEFFFGSALYQRLTVFILSQAGQFPVKRDYGVIYYLNV